MDVGHISRNNRRRNIARSSSRKGARESQTESERNNKLNIAERTMRPQILFPKRADASSFSDQELLLRKVRSVLNRISPVNYHRLCRRWLNLMPTNIDQISEVVQLVVAKALDDTQYMCIYARLMGVLSRRGNSGQKVRSLQVLLSTQIHHELQKLATDQEIAKFHHSMEQEWIARRKKVTLYRLIAELYVENAISLKFLMERIADVIATYSHPEEADESLECLCVVLTFAGQKLDETRKEWMDELFNKLNLKESEKLAISKRIQFMVLDLLEMRSNSWIPHNKWWVPSVQLHTFSSANSVDMEEKSKTDNMYLDFEDSTSITTGIATASRQRRESGKKTTTTTTTTTSTDFNENVASPEQQERTLLGILNKVTPTTLSQFTDYLPQVLPKDDELLDISVDTMLRKILSDPSYVQIYVRLISHAADTSLEFEKKVKDAVVRHVEGNLTCLGGIRILAELFNVDIVSYQEIQKTIETLLLVGDACLESLCNLLFLTGKKLDMELKDAHGFNNWMNILMEQLEERANICTNIRLRSFMLDVIDLANNYWIPSRSLNYIHPQMVNPLKKPYDIGSIIKIISKNNIDVVQASLCSRNIAEKFVFEGLDWAIADGSVEASKLIARCLKIVMKEKSLAHVRPRLQLILGRLIQHIAVLKGKNSEAWVSFGKIMDDLYAT